MYEYEAVSVPAFVQQVETYVRFGYWFYVQSTIPEWKEVEDVDAKLIDGYGIAIDKHRRVRRKRKGFANLQYLRYERDQIIMATRGEHAFFERETPSDLRVRPVQFHGYSIGCILGRDGKRHVTVRIAESTFRDIAAYFEEMCVKWSEERLRVELERLSYGPLWGKGPFEPWSQIASQFRQLLKRVNRRRKSAGFSTIAVGALPLRRRRLKVFTKDVWGEHAAA